MKGHHSDIGTRNSRRFGAVLAAVPLIPRLVNEVRITPPSPWYLEDYPRGQRHIIVLLYGSLRRIGVTLRIVFVVLSSWWKHPLEPEIISNGSALISSSLAGVFKPVLWMASVAIAGVVGSDFANSSSNIVSSSHVKIWISAAILFGLCLAFYHWWKLLERLRRVLSKWVMESIAKENDQRKTDDIARFGYAFGNNFRGQFNLRGVKFLSIFTFSATIYIGYKLGN